MTSAAGTGPPAVLRRSDAGAIRLGERDISGLLLAGQMYGLPYDLLAVAARLGQGPAWCWLPRTGLASTGLPYTASATALGRLAHVRAVLAVRLSLQASDGYLSGHGW